MRIHMPLRNIHERRRRETRIFRPEEVFDELLRRAGKDGADEVLLGYSEREKAAAHKKLCGCGFSQLFLEVPLAGRAGFDLHIVQDAENIRKQAPYDRDLYDGYGELFSWYAGQPSCGDGLDVVYDFREGLDAPPMAYLKMSDDTPDFTGFFREAGDSEGASRYGQKVRLLPDGWAPWYTGTHTGRPGKPLRIGCALHSQAKSRYAEDMRLLDHDLQRLGFPAPLSSVACDSLSELFALPYPVDVQLDVMEDGSFGPMLGISLCTGNIGAKRMAASLNGGSMRDAMELLERWEVADSRWKKLEASLFQVSAALRSGDGDRRRFVLSGNIGFIKVRFRKGEPAHDAKAYINLRATAHRNSFA